MPLENYIPKKGYHKFCKNCEGEFYGRKNKEYCCKECKAAFNNRKATEGREGLMKEFKLLEKNHQLLKKFLPQGEEGIHPKVLKGLGFDDKGYTKRVIEGNTEYFIIKDMAYYLLNGKIYIIKYIET